MTPRPVRGRHADARNWDVVVVGGGVAGLSTALALSGFRVALLTKGAFARDGASPFAQGGLAAAWGASDTVARHAADTRRAGAGLCDPLVVSALTGAAPGAVRRLIALGASFDADRRGRLLLGREGAHGVDRILHAGGDATGRELVRALASALATQGGLEIFEHAQVEELVTGDAGRVLGVLARDGDVRVLHAAGAVVLATGGLGRLYRYTTNPPEATGDGLALAARAGAVLADLEFVQFHPTAMLAGTDPLPLVSEALRGAGATVVDQAGRRVLRGAHPDAELAPRDVVARALWEVRRRGQRVFLDATRHPGDVLPARFPTVFALCRAAGLDPRRDWIPITPAAHYAMGGIATDGQGRTSVPGLWACGEVACTGSHGANRLASNSLLEGIVFGERVGRALQGESPQADVRAASRGVVWREPPAASLDARSLRRQAWERLGLVRDAAGLRGLLDRLAPSARGRRAARAGSRSGNLRTVARLVAGAALAREESRGAHYRSDYPSTLEAWRRRAFWTYAPDADEALRTVPREKAREIA